MDMNDFRGKVLIVDDESAIRAVLAEALHLWGYNTIEAADAATARAVFEQEQPIAVITDINLPDGSGLKLLREFKRREPPPVVIVITGDVVVENTISALRGDADDFISKPIDVHELHLALANCLAARKSDTLPPEKLRVLMLADTEERLKALRAIFNPDEVEIETVKTSDELPPVCQQPHELAIIDLDPAQLEVALSVLRASELHSEIPVLVSALRLIGGMGLAGLLPKYRAMSCSPTEMAGLVHRQAQALNQSTRGML
ncbi:MAG: response regulator [Acidobacteria bacterium]|nr:response regulator [Acidobacteriota bacterium]